MLLSEKQAILHGESHVEDFYVASLETGRLNTSYAYLLLYESIRDGTMRV
jgi:hypothetical protein